MVQLRSSAIAPPSCRLNSSAAGPSTSSGVRAVWIRLENGLPKAPRLLIATAITMTAREIIDATAGMVKRGLAALFHNVSLLTVWDRKCRKFSGPIAPHPLEIRNAA